MRLLVLIVVCVLSGLEAMARDGHLLVRERQMDLSAPPPPENASRPGPVASDWFWSRVPSGRTPAGPARWQQALETVAGSDAAAAPGLDARVRRIARKWGRLLRREAANRNVTLPLLIAVVAVESGGNPRAISPKGAGGLMQLMPFTARRFGVRNSLAPAQNVRGGARYLSWLLERFDEDPVLALAGYNAGEGAIEKHGGVPPYAETRDYVPMVAAAFIAASQLCTKPAPGIREPCEPK
ncbi:MAG: lytic transglycosylase domain-containing protein [Pseudomonadota bacterium]